MESITPEPKDNDIIRETGLVENYWGDTVSEYIHQFLNVLPCVVHRFRARNMVSCSQIYGSLAALKGWDTVKGLQFENLVVSNFRSLLPWLGLPIQSERAARTIAIWILESNKEGKEMK